MKRYLLIKNDYYYASGGTRDWIDCFETLEEAEKRRDFLQQEDPNKDLFHQTIVDLFEWTGFPESTDED